MIDRETEDHSKTLLECPVCHLKQGSVLALALHMMRGKPSFVEHSAYIEHVTGMSYTAFIREPSYVRKLAKLLQKGPVRAES